METPTLYLRRGTPWDVDTILEWRQETAKWLREEKGSEQWAIPYPRERLQHWIDQGATVMAALEPGGRPVATATVSPDADPNLWTASELEVPARYLYKLNVRRSHAGRGIGDVLIDWAAKSAAKNGARVLRCDVWSTNAALQNYYIKRGFRYLRTVPGTVSGALFETPVRAIAGSEVIEAHNISVP